MAELVDASDSKSGIGNNVQVRFLFWALLNPVSHWFTWFFLFRCVIFSRFLPLSAAFIDTKLTHRMTHQKDVPIPAHNQHCQVSKTHPKRPYFLHLTHQMTHGLTHDLVPKFVFVSLLVVEMAVMAKTSGTFHKNYSFRFISLFTSLIKSPQSPVYKSAEPIGMAHSLNIDSFTI